MRSWWRENGSFVLGGIVLGIAAIVGWNYWQSTVRQAELDASTLYETLIGEVADGDLEAAESAAATLYTDYASTVYPAHARLAMARLYMDKGRDQDAATTLEALVEGGGDSALRAVARLRLARVLLYQNKAEAVVELLEGQTDSAFAARYSEALGDAYAALGRHEDAARAYAVAVADDPAAPTVDRTLIQMKINDLPEPGEVAAIDETLREPPADEGDAAADDADESAP